MKPNIWQHINISKMKFLLIFTLIAALGSALADDLSPARLLVHKRLLNKYLVEGRDVVVDYNIYNIGESLVITFEEISLL
ncbi:UNVERIFIED_CONTAM: Translocon-associated protein subunit beta [Trichonephila clavipes]